jgi:hypothetical protein
LAAQVQASVIMKSNAAIEQLGALDKVIASLPAPAGALNPVYLYEDAQTRNWVRGVHERLERLAGGGVRATWWRLGDFSQAGVLAGAVSTTIRAGLVVVALRGSEGLPLPFYVWVNSWLPHRVPGTSALISLLEQSGKASFYAQQVRAHLKAVAVRGGMKSIMADVPGQAKAPVPAEVAAMPAIFRTETGADARRQSTRVSDGWSALATGGLARWEGI